MSPKVHDFLRVLVIASLLSSIHEAAWSTHNHHDVVNAIEDLGKLLCFVLCVEYVALQQVCLGWFLLLLLIHFALLGGEYLQDHPKQL